MITKEQEKRLKDSSQKFKLIRVQTRYRGSLKWEVVDNVLVNFFGDNTVHVTELRDKIAIEYPNYTIRRVDYMEKLPTADGGFKWVNLGSYENRD